MGGRCDDMILRADTQIMGFSYMVVVVPGLPVASLPAIGCRVRVSLLFPLANTNTLPLQVLGSPRGYGTLFLSRTQRISLPLADNQTQHRVFRNIPTFCQSPLSVEEHSQSRRLRPLPALGRGTIYFVCPGSVRCTLPYSPHRAPAVCAILVGMGIG